MVTGFKFGLYYRGQFADLMNSATLAVQVSRYKRQHSVNGVVV